MVEIRIELETETYCERPEGHQSAQAAMMTRRVFQKKTHLVEKINVVIIENH